MRICNMRRGREWSAKRAINGNASSTGAMRAKNPPHKFAFFDDWVVTMTQVSGFQFPMPLIKDGLTTIFFSCTMSGGQVDS